MNASWCFVQLRLLLAVIPIHQAIASYSDPVWQAEVASSAFVGIVECGQAGSGLARVKVLESWKGPRAGRHLILSASQGPLEGNGILLLVGQKYLILGKRLSPDRSASPTLLGMNYEPGSLLRRHAEYGVGIFWGCILLPTAAPLSGTPTPLSRVHQDVAALKQDVVRFLAQSPSEQEKETLQAVFLARLPRNRSVDKAPLEPDAVRLSNEVRRATTAHNVLRIILKPGPGNHAAMSAVDCGSAETLRVLLRQSPAESPFSPHVLQATIKSICATHPELATNLALRPNLSPTAEVLRMTGMVGRLAQEKYATNQASQFRRLLVALRTAQAPAEMLTQMSELGTGMDGSAHEQMVHVIAAGGPETLRALESVSPENFGLGGGIWEEARAALRLRLGLRPTPWVFSGLDDRTSGDWWHGTASEAKRALWREQLARNDDDNLGVGGVFQSMAFMRMTIHDPAGAVDWMVNLEPTTKFRRGWPDISLFAAYFSDYCPTDRDEHLRRLLTARHPSVRSIAAAALAADDPKAVLPVLHELRDERYGPGNLANLELARRGDKAAMDRLSEQLKPITSTNFMPQTSRFAWPVADEAAALLSNAAKASSLPQPEGDFAAWWNAHRVEVKLGDPWLAEDALMKR